MTQVQIQQVNVGQAMQGKFGTFYPVGIKVNDEWINGAMPQPPSWQAGDTVNVELFTQEYQGKIYKKFKVSKVDLSSLEDRVASLEATLARLEGKNTSTITPESNAPQNESNDVIDTGEKRLY